MQVKAGVLAPLGKSSTSRPPLVHSLERRATQTIHSVIHKVVDNPCRLRCNRSVLVLRSHLSPLAEVQHSRTLVLADPLWRGSGSGGLMRPATSCDGEVAPVLVPMPSPPGALPHHLSSDLIGGVRAVSHACEPCPSYGVGHTRGFIWSQYPAVQHEPETKGGPDGQHLCRRVLLRQM